MPATVGELIQQTGEYPDYVKAVNAAEDLETALWVADKTFTGHDTKSALQSMQKATLASHQAKLASDQASRESQIGQIAQRWAGETPASIKANELRGAQWQQAGKASAKAQSKVETATGPYGIMKANVGTDLRNLETQVTKSNALINTLQVYNTERQRALRKGAGKLRRHAGRQCEANEMLRDHLDAAATAQAEAADAALKTREHMMRRVVLAILVILVAYRTMMAQMGGGANSVDLAILLAALVYLLYIYYHPIVQFFVHAWHWLMLQLGADS